MDHSITVLRVVGGIFQFYSNFNRTFCKHTGDHVQRPHYAASGLGLQCLVCHTKRTLGLYELKMNLE